MFQAYMRGWRRWAAGLVLVPGLSMVGVDALASRASAQERYAPNNRTDQAKELMRRAREAYVAKDYDTARELSEKARAVQGGTANSDEPFERPVVKSAVKADTERPVSRSSGDPKVLVGMAKQALEEGNLDKAQDLATQAHAQSAGIRWGLFDDTPDSILKDVKKARARRDREVAERLVTEARSLVEKPVKDPTQRSANLLAAEEKAKQAASLHGSYSMWDFGDRPAHVIADVRKAREAEKLSTKIVRTKPGETMDDDAPPTSTRSKTASTYGNRKKPLTEDDLPDAEGMKRKKEAVALMQEGRQLLVGRKYVEAKVKYTAAAKLNAHFDRDEDTPESELNRLRVAAQRRVTALVNEARTCAEIKDNEGAQANLDDADRLAKGMGMDTSSIEEFRVALYPAAPVIRTGGSTPVVVAPKPLPSGEEVQLPVIRNGSYPLPSDNRTNQSDPPPVIKPAQATDEPFETIPPVKNEDKPEVIKPIPPNRGQIIRPLEAVKGVPSVPDVDKQAESTKPPMVTDDPKPIVINGPKPIGADEPKPIVKDVPKPMVTDDPKPIVINGPKPIGADEPKPIVKDVPKPMVTDDPKPIVINGPKPIGADEPKPIVKDVPKPMVTDDPKPIVKAPPAADSKAQQMLNTARLELRKGELESARRIVVELINGPYDCKDEAIAVLQSIDTKEAEGKLASAQRAFQNGLEAYHAHSYAQALAIFNQIDGAHLTAKERKTLEEMIAVCTVEKKKMDDARAARTGEKLPTGPKPAPGIPEVPVVGPTPVVKTGSDSMIKQQEALKQVEFQKLRTKSLRVESEATARFGRGETDAALQDLTNFVAEVKGSSLEPGKQNLLVRPIEARMERLKILKHQTDFLTKEAKDRRDFKSEMTHEAIYKLDKQQEVAKLMKSSHKLMDEAKYKEAYVQLQKAQALDPDDPSVGATLRMADTMMRKLEFKRLKEGQEKWNWEQGNEWQEFPQVSGKEPIRFTDDPELRDRIMKRGRGNVGIMRSRTEKEKEIERKMTTPITVSFKNTPLESVVGDLRTMTGINFDLDFNGLREGNIDPKKSISTELKDISLKSALNIICQQAGLKHVIENEAIRISTPKGTSGRQQMKTLSVGDLVVPAPNYGATPGLSLTDSLRMATEAAYGLTPRMSANTPRSPAGSLPNGTSLGSGSNDLVGGASGRLRNNGTNAPKDGGASSNTGPANGTMERELIRLITTTIKPDSWQAMGGEGSIEYFPIGMAMVINQSPEVIEEVERLLESLRKLQDLEVSIEVKVVSLAETFYERIGVDFAMGIPTNAKQTNFLPNQGATGVNFNNNNFKGNVAGLQLPGVPTPDLDIPIRATSFGRAVPPFGGFTNSFQDGGISLGLAFLSDLQVQMFLEAAQGDTRTNVMQAPKLTALNGTSASMTVGDFQFFVTGVQVINVNGQLVFTPQNVPFAVGITQPIPPNASIQNGLINFTPTAPQTPGLGLFIQPVVSADRRFVRLNIQQSFTNLISGTQQIPITTIITPVFENGGQGQPTPFTQFLQQPRFSNLETQTVVVVPDGGTVVMGGLKYMTEGRNEFGPPVLSKIPYLNRLFKNVAYGREGRSILIMVTPRVIINREEQERQTGVRDDDFVGLVGP